MTTYPSKLAPFLSKKFRFYSNGPDYYDCFTLSRDVLRVVYDRDIPDYEARVRRKRCAYTKIIRTVMGCGEWNKIDLPKPADIILMRTSGTIIDHLALVVAPHEMLHIAPSFNSAIEDFTNSLYQNIIEGFYRWNPSK